MIRINLHLVHGTEGGASVGRPRFSCRCPPKFILIYQSIPLVWSTNTNTMHAASFPWRSDYCCVYIICWLCSCSPSRAYCIRIHAASPASGCRPPFWMYCYTANEMCVRAGARKKYLTSLLTFSFFAVSLWFLTNFFQNVSKTCRDQIFSSATNNLTPVSKKKPINASFYFQHIYSCVCGGKSLPSSPQWYPTKDRWPSRGALPLLKQKSVWCLFSDGAYRQIPASCGCCIPIDTYCLVPPAHSYWM